MAKALLKKSVDYEQSLVVVIALAAYDNSLMTKNTVFTRLLINLFTVCLLCFSSLLWAGFDQYVTLKGNFVQGGMVIGEAPKDATVTFAGKALKLTPEGKFVFGLGRDNEAQESITISLADGQSFTKILAIAKRDYRIQTVNGVAKKFVQKKPEAVLKRIRSEVNAVKAARAQHIERTDFLQSFEWPLLGRITGVFGSQRVYNGVAGRPHYGIDIAAPMGTKVVAPAAGVVTLAYDDMYYSGGTMIIDHGYGISSSFLHLSKLLVEVGQAVEQGEAIAEVGTGGRSTGPHLDWRMNWYSRRIDAQLLVPQMPVQNK